MKKMLAMAMALSMAAALVACGGAQQSSSSEPAKEEAAEETTEAVETAEAEVEEEPAAAEETGFEEIEIWSDEEVAFMNVNGVYFQPVPMSNGNENYEDYDLHFEADVAALENDLGYGKGDWIPYLTVDFELTNDDTGDVVSGTFMPMSASDGPHYGANIKMAGAGTYSVKLTFHSPEENGYLIHLDGETGPGGTLDEYFADGNLVLELPAVWNYTPQEW